MRARRVLACVVSAIALSHTVEASPRFARVDEPGSLGTGTMDLPGSGVALADVDGDGDDDLLVVHSNARIAIHRSDGAGHLLASDAISPRPVTQRGDWGALSVAPADLDNDGDLDLLLGATGGVYRLDALADGTFVDRTAFAFDGLWRQATSFSLADMDGDGLLDVYVVTYLTGTDWPHNRCDRDALFLQREGGWVRTPLPDLDAPGCGFGAVLFDHDRDGDPDAFVANDFGSFAAPSHVWRNDGIDASSVLRIRAVNDATEHPVRTYAMGVATGDLDGDGVLDLVTTSIGRAPLFVGDGAGHFRDVTEARGAGSSLGWLGTRVTWGAAIVDLDGDGVNDVLEAGGYLPLDPLLGAEPGGSPTLFYPGAAPRTEDATTFPAMTGEGEFRGIAIGDIDSDGAPDVAFAAGMGTANALFRNATPTDGTWLSVTARGTVSSREARGAIITLDCADGSHRTSVIPTGGNAGSFSAPRAFFSTASCGSASAIEVAWPSGCVSRHPLSSGVHHLTVEEPAWLAVDRSELRLDVPGANTARIVIDPARANPTMGAHDVELRQIAGDVAFDPLSPRADGSFETTARTSLAGDAWLAIVVDGRVVPRRIRLHTRDRIESEVRIVHEAVSPSRPVELAVVPRAADGSLVGPGARVIVEVPVSGAHLVAEDRGDGRYVSRIELPGAIPSMPVITAHIVFPDASTRDVTIPVVADIDAANTVLTLSPGTIVDGTHPAFVIAKVSPVTPLGDPFGVHLDERLRLVDESGAMVGRLASVGPASIAFTLDPDLVAGHDLRLRFGDLDASNTVRLQHVPDLAAVVARVDVARSLLDPMQAVLQADGVDTTALALHVVDADGNGLPLPMLSWNVAGGTLGQGAGSASDGSALWRVTAAVSTGALTANVRAGSIEWNTQLPLVESSASPVRALELCATGVSLPTGEAWIDVMLHPRRADRVLAGGARDVSLDAGGRSFALAWHFGSYAARIPIDRGVDATLLHATDRGTTTPRVESTPIDVTLALQTGPFVREDPRAEWHGENRCRIGGTLGTDAGNDAGDGDAAQPVHAGGGCGCRVIARDRHIESRAWFVALVVVALQRRKRGERHVRSLHRSHAR